MSYISLQGWSYGQMPPLIGLSLAHPSFQCFSLEGILQATFQRKRIYKSEHNAGPDPHFCINFQMANAISGNFWIIISPSKALKHLFISSTEGRGQDHRVLPSRHFKKSLRHNLFCSENLKPKGFLSSFPLTAFDSH